MIKLKGTTLYPPALNDVLDNTAYVENYVVVVEESEAGTDRVIVRIGLKYSPEFDAVKDLKDRFRSRIRVAPEIELLPVEETRRKGKEPHPAQTGSALLTKGLQNLPHSFGKECIRKGFQNEGQPECTEKKLAVELHALLAARGGRNEVPL